MSSYEKFLDDLAEFVSREYGSPSRMADAIDFSQSTLSKIFAQRSRPRIDTICDLLDRIGGRIVLPGSSYAVSPPKPSSQPSRQEANNQVDLSACESEISKLKEELEKEKSLARDLVQDNRQLTQDNRELMNELRELYKNGK